MAPRSYILRSRTVPVPTAPTYTQAQTQKNQVLAQFRSGYPITRQNRNNRSRGMIRQDLECYRTTALQCLLHLPKALHWLLAHDVVHQDNNGNVQILNPCESRPRDPDTGEALLPDMPDCMACAIKDLIQLYLGDAHLENSGDPRSLQPNDPIMDHIHRLADQHPNFKDLPLLDRDGDPVYDEYGDQRFFAQQSDPEEFLLWVLQQCYHASTPNTTPDWHLAYSALFELSYEERRFCSICDTHIPANPAHDGAHTFLQPSFGFTELDATDPAHPGTVASAIAAFLANEVSRLQRHCPTCSSLQEMTKRYRIESAPEYLAVKLNILIRNPDKDLENPAHEHLPEFVKIIDPLQLPTISRTLDLTNNQVDTSAPLRYKLVAMLPHGGIYGGGHWIAQVQRHPKTWSINDHRVTKVNASCLRENWQLWDVEENGRVEEVDFQAVVMMYVRT